MGLRVQLADDAPGAALSVAEVQVFANRSNTVSGFRGGGTVAARPWTAPYQADASLSNRFADVPVGGRWTLEVVDRSRLDWFTEQTIKVAQGNASVPATDRRGGNPGATEKHGPGQLADWVLLLTDEAGVVTAHYMDIVATVTALPKYGTLAADARSLGSGNSHDEWGVGRSDATKLDWRLGDGRHAQLMDAGEGSGFPRGTSRRSTGRRGERRRYASASPRPTPGALAQRRGSPFDRPPRRRGE